MMKKMSILLVCVLLLTAVGCGSQKASEKENTAEHSSSDKGYHLYNYTGKYEPNPNCTYCNGTGYYDWVCDACNGDGLRRPDVCFQCFGEGTCFVTPGSGDGPGWWETCSICHGTGINADTIGGPCRACEGVGVRKNAIRCEHCWE